MKCNILESFGKLKSIAGREMFFPFWSLTKRWVEMVSLLQNTIYKLAGTKSLSCQNL